MSNAFYIGYKGRLEAYIYIWFSKEKRIVYVGETNNINGVIGRANQHIEHGKGTLYKRIHEKGYELDEINDFILLSYPLPREKRFLSEETSYRISVEYLVQKKLIELRKNVDKPYIVISNVVPGPYTNMKKIEIIADEISNDFVDIYLKAQYINNT